VRAMLVKIASLTRESVSLERASPRSESPFVSSAAARAAAHLSSIEPPESAATRVDVSSEGVAESLEPRLMRGIRAPAF
jgi:hypothetical protein